MIHAAASVQFFGIFLILEGLLLLSVPDLFLSLFLLDAKDAWVRILGLALAILGYFYFRLGRENVRSFLILTTHSRTAQFVVIAGFVSLGLIGPMILLPSGFEFLCGLWTLYLLKREQG